MIPTVLNRMQVFYLSIPHIFLVNIPLSSFQSSRNRHISALKSVFALPSNFREQSQNIERFIEKVHKYFDLQELIPTILNDMVKQVYVHAPQKIDGKRTQKIDIYYDFVGFLPLSLFQAEKQDRVA